MKVVLANICTMEFQHIYKLVFSFQLLQFFIAGVFIAVVLPQPLVCVDMRRGQV